MKALKLDRKTLRQLRVWVQVEALVEEQTTARGKKKWTDRQLHSTRQALHGEWLDELAMNIIRLFKEQGGAK